jgi:hypothetical protein
MRSQELPLKRVQAPSSCQQHRAITAASQALAANQWPHVSGAASPSMAAGKMCRYSDFLYRSTFVSLLPLHHNNFMTLVGCRKRGLQGPLPGEEGVGQLWIKQKCISTPPLRSPSLPCTLSPSSPLTESIKWLIAIYF